MQGWAVIVRPLYFLAEVFWGAAGIWRDGLKVCGVDAEVFTGSWGKGSVTEEDEASLKRGANLLQVINLF